MVDYIKNQALERYRTAIFWLLVFLIISSAIIYLYCIGVIVMATVNRNSNLEKLQSLEREYQELENQYLSLSSKLDLDYAYALGFVNNAKTLTFVLKPTAVAQTMSYGEALR